MRRLQLFEFTDLAWYPETFRRVQTDYLQFVATRGSGQAGLVPLLVKAMKHAGTTEIVDLCSGGAGPWKPLQRKLAEAGWPVSVKLTDKYPNPAALRQWDATSQPNVEYVGKPVDALDVPPSLAGMRTLFESFTISSRRMRSPSCEPRSRGVPRSASSTFECRAPGRRS